MSAQTDLHRIVRSKQFQQTPKAKQADFIVGYFKDRQPDADMRAAFTQFSDAEQRQLAEEAIRRSSKETTGETLQGSIETASKFAVPLAATAGLSGAGPVTAAAVPAAMIGEFIPELTRPFLTDQAADLGSALERSAESGLLSLALGPVEKIAAIGGKVIGGVRTRLFNPRTHKDPTTGKMIENPEVTAARAVLEPRGGGLTLGQQRGTGQGFFENIARNSLVGEGRFAKLDMANEVALDTFADEIGRKIGQSMPVEELGVLVREQLTQGGQVARATGKELFKQVDAAAGGIATVQDDAIAMIQKNQQLPGMRKVFAAFNAGIQGGRKGLEQLLGKSQNGLAKFEDADVAAAELFAVARELEKKGEQGAANLSKALGAKVRTGIDDALDELPTPDLKQQANNARQFWKQEIVDKFESPVMREVVSTLRKKPGMIGRVVLNGGIDTLKAVKKATQTGVNGNPAMWPEIQTNILSTVMTRATDPVQGIFSGVRKMSGAKLLSLLQRLDEGNSQFVKELTGGTTALQDFRMLATAVDKAGLSVHGSGGVFIRLKQAGEFSNLVKGGQIAGVGSGMAMGQTAAGAGIFIVTPALLARWFTNRTAMTNLAEGLIGGPKSVAARRLATLAAVQSDNASEFVQQHFGEPLPPHTFDSSPTISAPR